MAAVGFPDATTTGVPAGATLTPYNGNLVINTPGAVISGLDIHGTVTINAANVTLVNCKVTTSHSNAVINITANGDGVTIQDCEINGGGSTTYGILNRSGGTGNTYLRCNIHGSENGIDPGNGDTVQDSYIWGLLNTDNADPHYDGIEFDGGSNLTIRHNTIIAPTYQNAAVMIDNYFGPVSNVIVDNNRLVGGSYTIFVDGRFSGGSITGVQITNNHIGATNWGYVSFSNNTPVYYGNVDDVTGQLISGQQGASTTPAITAFSTDSGVVGDGITNDNTLTLSGTAAANNTVKVYDGTTLLGQVTANSSGAWSYTTAALPDGGHSFSATATPTGGGVTSPASAAKTVMVDTVAPGAPTIASFSTDTGTVGDGITNDNTLTLTGTAPANSTVKVFDGATQIGTATANGSGAWSYTTGTLSNATHSFTATATDAAGNSGAASAALAVTVDSAAPAAPTITSFSTDSGTVGDGITNDNTLTLTGTAAANSAVKVFDGTTQIGTTTANGSGAWSYTTAALANGAHSITATATDAAGNPSAASAALNVTVDMGASVATVISGFSTDSGIAGDGITNDNSLTLTGTAAANKTVTVYDGATQIGTATANGSGTWSYTTGTLADGNHSFTAAASPPSSPLSVTVDTVAPSAPTITGSTDTGAVGDGITNDNTLILTGTAAANSTVKLFEGATLLGSTTANGSGAWSYTTGTLSDATHSFTARAMDAAGNTSSASAALNVTVDTAADNGLFGTVVKAINAGGDAVTVGGISYEADTAAAPNSLAPGSQNSTFSNAVAIAGTDNDVLHQTERWGGSFGYDIDLANGQYLVELDFAEIYWGATGGAPGGSGSRVFDVTVEGQQVISNLDLFNDLGAANATSVVIPVTVSDGVLDIDFAADANNAKLSALVVWDDVPVVKAINAGGGAVTVGGISYEADTAAAPNSLAPGSQNHTFSNAIAIAGTDNDVLYQTERWGDPFGYDISLANGQYLLELDFAEIYWGATGGAPGGSGSRVFDVTVEGQQVISNLDLFNDLGVANATSVVIPVTVNDGVLDIDFAADTNNAKLSALSVWDVPVVKAINAGGGAVTVGEISYEADTAAAPNSLAPGSQNSTFSNAVAIAGTDNDVLHQTERWGSFGYDINLANGQYLVELDFAEIYWGATGGASGGSGSRVFDVTVEGQQVISNLDLFKDVGAANATSVVIPVTVSDGVLDIDFAANADNAKLSSLVVYHSTYGFLL